MDCMCASKEPTISPSPIAVSTKPPIIAAKFPRVPTSPLDDPNMRRANSRAPTAAIAISETVIAVPMDIARTAAAPAHETPENRAKTSTRTAPVQGRIPIDRMTASDVRQSLAVSI